MGPFCRCPNSKYFSQVFLELLDQEKWGLNENSVTAILPGAKVLSCFVNGGRSFCDTRQCENDIAEWR